MIGRFLMSSVFKEENAPPQDSALGSQIGTLLIYNCNSDLFSKKHKSKKMIRNTVYGSHLKLPAEYAFPKSCGGKTKRSKNQTKVKCRDTLCMLV